MTPSSRVCVPFQAFWISSAADFCRGSAGLSAEKEVSEMTAVIQRVSRAAVKVDGSITGECGQGLAVLLGVRKGDTAQDALTLARKIEKLRIFPDDAGKMNRSLCDIGGGMLVVSNFTLLADYAHGNRPGFFDAEAPREADALYRLFADTVREDGFPVGCGVFGADMAISIEADGPVTLVLESEILMKKGNAAK